MNDFQDFDPSIAAEFGYSESQALEFMGIPVCDTDAILHLFMRFGFHLLVCLLIIHFCYYRKTKNRDYYKSFMFFASGMFLLLFLLESIKLQIGLTLGLFAIFGVIRYRTETVPIKEMTYLFMIIVISVINGLSLNISYLELLLANLALFAIMFLFEYRESNAGTYSKLILYDRIEMIVPEKRDELIEDLKQRTGLDVATVEVGHIDFLRDAAFLKIYYHSDHYEGSTIGQIMKLKP